MVVNSIPGTDTEVRHEGKTLPEGVDEAALETASLLFKALGDPTRLAILAHLSLGDHRVVDLTNHLGLSQSTVSAHLACLRGCGLITSRNVGRATVHSLAYPEIMPFLRRAEDLLALTGNAVTFCPVQHDDKPTVHAGAPADIGEESGG